MKTAVASSREAQEFVRELRALGGNLRAEYDAERAEQPRRHENIIPLHREDAPWSISRRLALAAALALFAILGAVAVGTWKRSEGGAVSGKLAIAEAERVIVTGSYIPTAEMESALPEAAAVAAAPAQDFNTASYRYLKDNSFLAAASNPLSTFSIDVDTASYANVRRFLEQGALPPKDAVRIEEMINYFSYDYPLPNDEAPFSVQLDAASCPWAPAHRLVRIGLRGREVPNDQRPASNLVFLLDVSGSMEPAQRLPLVKQALRLLVDQLGENDRVAIVVYSGASGLALPSTSGALKEKILAALENLRTDGSTDGAQGIELAYQTAAAHFIEGGVNRVVLATDGDFNVGTTSEGDLVRLIQEKARGGIFLSVLGVGDDNLNDSMMQQLADQGNGNYAYLDSLAEAKKVLVRQINGTLVTIAKDVKIQVEFNPQRVASYRLIGYEKRLLQKEDFNQDQIDAGEIGAGHTVTALYEVVPAGAGPNPAASVPAVDPLKYQAVAGSLGSPELLTVKLRYQEPTGSTSKLLERPFVDGGADFASAASDLKFAAAVAEFGMILRDSEFRGEGSLGAVAEWAREGKGADANGYRAGFLELVRKAQDLKGRM